MPRLKNNTQKRFATDVVGCALTERERLPFCLPFANGRQNGSGSRSGAGRSIVFDCRPCRPGARPHVCAAPTACASTPPSGPRSPTPPPPPPATRCAPLDHPAVMAADAPPPADAPAAGGSGGSDGGGGGGGSPPATGGVTLTPFELPTRVNRHLAGASAAAVARREVADDHDGDSDGDAGAGAGADGGGGVGADGAVAATAAGDDRAAPLAASAGDGGGGGVRFGAVPLPGRINRFLASRSAEAAAKGDGGRGAEGGGGGGGGVGAWGLGGGAGAGGGGVAVADKAPRGGREQLGRRRGRRPSAPAGNVIGATRTRPCCGQGPPARHPTNALPALSAPRCRLLSYWLCRARLAWLRGPVHYTRRCLLASATLPSPTALGVLHASR